MASKIDACQLPKNFRMTKSFSPAQTSRPLGVATCSDVIKIGLLNYIRSSNYYQVCFKDSNFCEYVKFRAIY